MRTTTWLGTLTGSLLLLSSFAHAFMGWPTLVAALAGKGVDAQTLAGLAAGWYFGSVAMAVFGVQTLLATRRGAAGAWGLVATIGGGYLAFGLVGFFVRGGQPHYLGFVVLGLMLAGFAALARKRP